MKLGKSKIFLFLCLSFILGVFSGSYLNYYVMAFLAMIFVMMVTIPPPLHLPLSKGEKKEEVRLWLPLIGFLGLTLLLGAFRLKTSFPNQKENYIGKFYGQKMEIQGAVVKEPDIRSKQINLTISPEGFVGNILVNAGRYPEYQYGDLLKISGKLEEPFESEEFSYKNYLSRYDTYALMRFPKIEKLAYDKGNPVTAVLLRIKAKFQEVLSKSLPEPHNALMLGLILGLKKALPQDLKEALIIAGVSHIVVISGYNISIITKNILKTRAWWGRRVAFWLSLLVVLAFVVMTGAEASVIRAAVMGLLLAIALNVGRIYQAANALVFAGALMVALSPKILRFDTGFQLSFLATLGLIYLTPMFERWLAFLPDILGFRTNLSSTLGAQIFTLPLLVYYFDRISVFALPANVLILWVIPYTMFFGFFTSLLGVIYLPLAKLLAGIVWLFLEYQIRVIEFFAHLPLSSASVKINTPLILIFYLLLVFGLWIYRHKKRFYYQLEYLPPSYISPLIKGEKERGC